MHASRGAPARRALTGALLAGLACALAAGVPARAATPAPASGTVDLADLSGFGTSFDAAAASAALLGDVDGDGVGDAAIGVPTADPGGRVDAGSVYVVFGRRDAPAPVALGALGGRGYRIDGFTSGGRLGTSIAALGSIDGDNLADFAVGAPRSAVKGRGRTGAVFIVRGAQGPTPDVDLTAGAGSRIAGIFGEASGDEFGSSLAPLPAAAGGANGLVIGARFADPQGRSAAGRAYVLPGALPSSRNHAITGLLAAGYRIDGPVANARLGHAVGSSPDMTGDGVAEVLVGAPLFGPDGAGGYAGAAFAVPSRPIGAGIDLAVPTGEGMVIVGSAGMQLGSSVVGIGDINGDTMPDVAVGAPTASPGARRMAGSIFVVGGRASSVLPIPVPNASSVAIGVEGATRDDRFGRKLALADLDGDGVPDLLVSAPNADPLGRSNAGAVYALRGRDLRAGLIDTALLGRSGVRIAGSRPADHVGNALATGSDTGADGRADVLVGGMLSSQLLDVPAIAGSPASIGASGPAGCVVKNDIELVVDDSGSLRRGDPQLLRRAAIEQMLAKPRSTAITLGAIEIGTRQAQIFPPLSIGAGGLSDGRELASLRGLLDERIRNDAGLTDYAGGLLAAARHHPAADALLLITDGTEPLPAAALPASGRRVHVLRLRSSRPAPAVPRLRELAEASGGQYFDAVDAASLPAALTIVEASLACEQALTTRVATTNSGSAPAPPTSAPTSTVGVVATTTVAAKKPTSFVTGLPQATTSATLSLSFKQAATKRPRGRLRGSRGQRCVDASPLDVRAIRVFGRRKVAVRASARQLRLALTGKPVKIGRLYAFGRCGRGFLSLRITGLQRIAGAGARSAANAPTRMDLAARLKRNKSKRKVSASSTASKRRGGRR